MSLISFEGEVTAYQLQDTMKDRMIEAGWEEIDDFYKYVIVNHSEGFCFTIARHVIVANSTEDYFGISLVNEGCYQGVTIPSSQRRLNDDDKVVGALKASKDTDRDYYRIYLYQLFDYVKQRNSTNMVHIVDNDVDRLPFALDVEHIVADGQMRNTYIDSDEFILLSNREHEDYFLQSPIVKIDTFNRKYFDSERFPNKLNLWEDSLYQLDGCIDEETAFFLLEIDSSPMWKGNVPSRIPIYLGNVELYSRTVEEKACTGYSACLFAGTAFVGELDEGRFYDFSDITLDTEYIFPIKKNDRYLSEPSNGITTVMLKKTKMGALYQKHYISNFTPSNEIPVPREGADGEQYQRAFQNYWTNTYKYQFNPSKYTNKVHTSRPEIVHPDLGVTGVLRNILMVQDVSLTDKDELVYINEAKCGVGEGKEDIYTYFKISSISPLSKKPSVVFVPNGVGIKVSKEHTILTACCDENEAQD